MNEAYENYLKSDEWKVKRQQTLERDSFTCQVCGAKDNLRVHHKTYANVCTPANVYNERPDDLITVCDKCHEDIHKLGKIFWSIMDEQRKYLRNRFTSDIIASLKTRDKCFGGDLNFLEKGNTFTNYVNKLKDLIPASDDQRKAINNTLKLGLHPYFVKARNEHLKEVWKETQDIKVMRDLGVGASTMKRILKGEWD